MISSNILSFVFRQKRLISQKLLSRYKTLDESIGSVNYVVKAYEGIGPLGAGGGWVIQVIHPTSKTSNTNNPKLIKKPDLLGASNIRTFSTDNKRMLHHLDQRFIQLSMRILKSFLHFNRMILIQVLKKCTQFYSNLLKLWWYKVHLTFEFPQLKWGFNRKSSFSVLKSNLTLSKALLLYFQRALFWSHYSILISTIPT